MVDFEDYFSFYMIVEQLSLQRAKLSFYAHKNSYLNDYCKTDRWFVKDPHKIDDISLLKSILPPRKHWSRPNKNVNRKRYTSSIELNKVAIKNRVYIEHKDFISGKLSFHDTKKWYQNLRYFLFELRLTVFSTKSFSLNKPDIFPAKKNPDKKFDIARRPLAKFMLRDKIILSLTNKYLTKIFDTQFSDVSFAFRSKNSWKCGPTYHDAVSHLQQFRKVNKSERLFVAECDIQKFFDCLDHDIIAREYHLLKEIISANGHIIHNKAEEILFAYLKCYSFNNDVFPKNQDPSFWIKHNDCSPPGQFEWVKELIEKEGSNDGKKIGIPQGGALSGLIVNILLHKADRALIEYPGWGDKYIYLRYCDDMVIVHTSAEQCEVMFNNYTVNLDSLNLIAHPPKKLGERYSKSFWEGKSRNVYFWSAKRLQGFSNSPWVSFLGYMVNYDGNLKVRKKSIEKQEKKHLQEAKKVIDKLKRQDIQDVFKHKDSIIQSFETKMYSMAVGKVDIGNYRNSAVEMCWAAGFQLIEENRYTKIQLRKLDRSRKDAILEVKKYLKKTTFKLETDETGEIKTSAHDGQKSQEDGKSSKKKKIIVYSRYPHSFYSILDRPKNNSLDDISQRKLSNISEISVYGSEPSEEL